MEKIEIRVEMSTNSGARALGGARNWKGVAAQCRHNGGKTVVMSVASADVAALEAALDAAYDVRSYTGTVAS